MGRFIENRPFTKAMHSLLDWRISRKSNTTLQRKPTSDTSFTALDFPSVILDSNNHLPLNISMQ
jgi:hypothetical protein